MSLRFWIIAFTKNIPVIVGKSGKIDSTGNSALMAILFLFIPPDTESGTCLKPMKFNGGST